MEELIPMRFDWKVFDSSLAVARKNDFQRLLEAIDNGSHDEGKRERLAGRMSTLFTNYVGLFDSLNICEIEYGTDNPFDVPEKVEMAWRGVVLKMEHRMGVLSGIAARREKVRVTPRFGPLKVEGEGAKQHGKILSGFERLCEVAKHDEFQQFRTPVLELVQLYEDLRREGIEVSQFEQLEQLLAGEEINWTSVEQEVHRLENPERRIEVSWLEAGWEVGEQVLAMLKSGEITWEDVNGVAKTRHERIQDGFHRLYERDGFMVSCGLDELPKFAPLHEQTKDLEDTLALEVANRYGALAEKGRVGDRFARLEELLGDEEVIWEELEQEVERLENSKENIYDLEPEKSRTKIELREAAWLAAKVFSSKEITGQQVAGDLAYLEDPKSRESITWWGVTKLGGKAIWNAMRSDSDDGITWRQVETVVGPLKYAQNEESVSSKHLAWLGLELFDSEEVTFEQVNGKLKYLVKPANRAKIGWGQIAKMGLKVLWRAVVGSPRKNEKKEELISPLRKTLPWLKSKLKSVDGAMVAKLAIGLAALMGIGLIAYNFEAIRHALTGGHGVGDTPVAPPVVHPPPVEPPPIVVTKPPVLVPPKHIGQGLHLHNGVWSWG